MSTCITDLRWRYAVKKFDVERILSAAQIKIVKEAFNLTATSYGLQPISLVLVANKELQRQLVAHSFDQQQVAQASHVLVICIEKEVDADYIARYFKQVKSVRGLSSTVLDPFKDALVADFSNKDVQEIKEWSKNQAYLAMGNLLTVFAAEKIDSCPMEGFVPQAYDEVLGLEKKGLTSVLVLPIGYRAKDDVFATFKKVRKDISESIIEIN